MREVVIHDVGRYFGLSDKRPWELGSEKGREWRILKFIGMVGNRFVVIK